ncbi:CST complex subunit CTC1 [Biomphalaria pfeifferi]|uniref:CST complex subunit CTC1 n=1 Tax=Biomphalaria pfeifferi TaxID=112525 RepID=A0AAD8BAD7_BIOPF|nr:CST complex subunit CTC1 [Biomphalaria pfeifferi]
MNFVVTSHTAACIAMQKDKLPEKLYLSIKGTVTSLSDVLRVKNDGFSLIELDNCVLLLVKDYHKDWFSILQVNRVYVFKNIRLTQIEKGIIKPCPIFYVWCSSTLVETECEDIPVTDLKGWLHGQGMKNGLIDEASRLEECQKRIYADLQNYQGTITCCDKASAGFYRLDNKIGLNVGLSNFCKSKLKLNAKVSLYNVHLIEEASEVTLVCCAKTTIKLDQPDDGQSCNSTNIPDSLEDVVLQYGLNYLEVEKLLAIYDCLLLKHRKCKMKSENAAIMILKNSYYKKTHQRLKTTAFDCFIYHEYCPQSQFSLSRSLVPEVFSLENLSDEDSIFSSLPPSCYSSDRYFRFWTSGGPESKILIGSIQTSSGGNLVFSDGSHTFPLLLLHSSLSNNIKSTQPEAHMCSKACSKPPSSGSHCLCPFITASHLNKLICVQYFIVVSEDLLSFSTTESSNANNTLTYLAFCLCDTYLLNSCSLVNKSDKDEVCTCLPMLQNDVEDKSSNVITTQVYVTEKHALKLKTILNTQSSFDVLGYEFSSLKDLFNAFSIPTLKPGHASKGQDKPVADHGMQEKFNHFPNSISKQQNKINSEENHWCKHLEQVTAVGATLNHGNNSKFGSSKCVTKPNLDKLKPIIITFAECSLYPLILPGHAYEFRVRKEPGETNVFETNFDNNLLQKAATHSKVRLRVVAPSHMTIHKLSLQSSSQPFLHQEQLYSVSEVIAEGFSQSVVSFKAVIVCFDLSPSFSLGAYCKKIEVSEYSPFDPSAAVAFTSVYMDAAYSPCSLGLVPGAVVDFYRLQRKVSQKGNVYFRFVTLSSTTVISLQNKNVRKAAAVYLTFDSLTNVPKELLLNLWREGPVSPQKLYEIECNICLFFRLTVKVVCSKCNSVLVEHKCKGCKDPQSCTAQAIAIILIDDGTSSASCKVSNPEHVRQLLTLTETQWDDLLEVAKKDGELMVTKVSGNTTSVIWFLSNLTNSTMVLRCCRFVVRIYQKSPWAKTLEAANISDLQLREERIGQNVLYTHSPPLLQVECLALQNC